MAHPNYDEFWQSRHVSPTPPFLDLPHERTLVPQVALPLIVCPHERTAAIDTLCLSLTSRSPSAVFLSTVFPLPFHCRSTLLSLPLHCRFCVFFCCLSLALTLPFSAHRSGLNMMAALHRNLRNHMNNVTAAVLSVGGWCEPITALKEMISPVHTLPMSSF